MQKRLSHHTTNLAIRHNSCCDKIPGVATTHDSVSVTCKHIKQTPYFCNHCLSSIQDLHTHVKKMNAFWACSSYSLLCLSVCLLGYCHSLPLSLPTATAAEAAEDLVFMMTIHDACLLS